ncbi:MAG: hypothetical protein ACI81T_002582 [Bacteroidia bacterium]|jgi:hypothetical protein
MSVIGFILSFIGLEFLQRLHAQEENSLSNCLCLIRSIFTGSQYLYFRKGFFQDMGIAGIVMGGIGIICPYNYFCFHYALYSKMLL